MLQPGGPIAITYPVSFSHFTNLGLARFLRIPFFSNERLQLLEHLSMTFLVLWSVLLLLPQIILHLYKHEYIIHKYYNSIFIVQYSYVTYRVKSECVLSKKLFKRSNRGSNMISELERASSRPRNNLPTPSSSLVALGTSNTRGHLTIKRGVSQQRKFFCLWQMTRP